MSDERKERWENLQDWVTSIQVSVSTNSAAIRVWNDYTQTWWRCDLYQETPHRTDTSKSNGAISVR